MPLDSQLHRMLEQVAGSHLGLVRFVGRIPRHEWDWAPDEGIPSARDVVNDLVREEARLAAKLLRDSGAVAATAPCTGDWSTPAVASQELRGLRERTLATLRALLPPSGDAIAAAVSQSAVSLAQFDAHALGGLAMLQRLIDPSRAGVSPR